MKPSKKNKRKNKKKYQPKRNDKSEHEGFNDPDIVKKLRTKTISFFIFQ